jgi:hypothetical protein
MVTLTTNEIFNIGSTLSQSLIKNQVTKKNELILVVDKESFLKIDEDLYYRNNTEEEFSPSQTQINIAFPCLDIIILKESSS